MEIFKFKNEKYITINGKDYYLLRLYTRDNDKWGLDKEAVFIQAFGKIPLQKSDLPEGEWEIIKTRQGKEAVYTAYKKPYFLNGNGEKKVARPQVFVGMDTEGSYYLALKYLNEKLGKKATKKDLKKLTKILMEDNHNYYEFRVLQDYGNAGINAVKVDLNNEYYLNKLFDTLSEKEET